MHDDLAIVECSPAMAVAMTATTNSEAEEMAQELVEDLYNLWPAWRGWGIKYNVTGFPG